MKLPAAIGQFGQQRQPYWMTPDMGWLYATLLSYRKIRIIRRG